MNAKNRHIIAVIAVVILCVGAFYAGMQYGKRGSGANNPKNASQMRGQQFGFGGQGGQKGAVRANGGFINGEIISKDDKSITVKMQDGGSKIVFLSATA
ncbi:hypothetical protein HZA42_05470 [Candidatus Peregrinibacteria bacterium]|nr:hypothetical protein [Candidatus Peregrinibacteria bacterium]